MAMMIEPRPAALPLAGGQEGATVRLHPLLSGELLCPPGLFDRPKGRFAILKTLRSKKDTWFYVPVPAYLVEHPSAGPILVDTGLHHSVALDPAQNFGKLFARFNKFRMDSEQAVPAQLRERGIDPAAIGTVVMTHLHNDHASGVEEFPEATFVIDAAEWEDATTGRPLFKGYARSQFDYGFDWRAVDFNADAIDSFATFGRTVDLLGDGSIRLLSTPGHTAGHMSVLLRLAGREALLTADAAYNSRCLDGSATPLLLRDAHVYERSLREIRRYIEQTPSALVITGHDPEAWRALEESY